MSRSFLISALCAMLCSPSQLIATERSVLAAYVDMLEAPEMAWAERAMPDPTLDTESARKRAELEAMLGIYAPRIWWHSADPFGPMDPVEFVKNSSLWKGPRWVKRQLIAPRGTVRPAELRGHTSADYFLVNEDQAMTSARPGGLSHDAPFSQGSTPMFWRLGNLKQPGRVLIEYWYHLGYSYANSYDVGNHQGDWEGAAMLLELGLDSKGRLMHRLLATFLAQHDGGTWHCASEVGLAEGHPELFTALGTHATYKEVGRFGTTFVTDRTARGRHWDGWRLLRPMVLEPYYGFAGSWGDVRFFPFMSGPAAPRPKQKWLPRRPIAEDEDAATMLRLRCGI